MLLEPTRHYGKAPLVKQIFSSIIGVIERVILKNETHKSCPFTIVPLTGTCFCHLDLTNGLSLRLWPLGRETLVSSCQQGGHCESQVCLGDPVLMFKFFDGSIWAACGLPERPPL